jgi:dTMP kinase
VSDRTDRGRFITFEGPDGAGKSIQARRLAATLERDGLQVLLTREPGGTPFSERVRALLVDADAATRGPLAEALLFNAARAELVADVIRPALEAGTHIVCDRYTDSTLAYQGHAGGADVDTLREINAAATGGLVPDRTILLDVPVSVGLTRRERGPRREQTRFEDPRHHDARYHDRVRDAFLLLAAEEPERWTVIDATLPLDVVSDAVSAAVRESLRPSEPVGPRLRIVR